MPGPRSGIAAARGQGSGTVQVWESKSQSVNVGRPHWTETCSYCGMALPKPDEDCPTEIIDRAAGALIGETT